MENMVSVSSSPQNNFTPPASVYFVDIVKYIRNTMPGFQDNPLEVVYGYLTIEDNRIRGGSPHSRHMIGEAIDVRPTPNTDERKCIIATVAETVALEKKLGTEIAIRWGLAGHVHIAILSQRNIHKRYSIDKGEVWTSKSLRNKMAVRKIIEKYNLKF